MLKLANKSFSLAVSSFKYSVLITPEFVQEGEVRPFVEQTSEHNKENWWGYLNKKEIKKMTDSNLVDFQAHGYTHTWYESSQELIDIYDNMFHQDTNMFNQDVTKGISYFRKKLLEQQK